MERNTLLATMWNTDGDADEAAETVRQSLASGELELTGNFRGTPASYWEEIEND